MNNFQVFIFPDASTQREKRESKLYNALLPIQTNRTKQLVHKSIQGILISALTLHATANLLSILELYQSGDGLKLDQRMLTVGMIWVALVSLSLHKAHQSRVVLLIFQEEIDHGVSSSRMRKG